MNEAASADTVAGVELGQPVERILRLAAEQKASADDVAAKAKSRGNLWL